MVCKIMNALDMHNLRSTYKVRIYLQCNLFQFLLIETIPDHTHFLHIQICNLKIHILYQLYYVMKVNEMTFNDNNLILLL